MCSIPSGHCPACGGKLRSARLACPDCKAEFPTDAPLSPYDYLSQEDAAFLRAFLTCRGNLKALQQEQDISYPTAKKKLDHLLTALGLCAEKEEETVDMSIFKRSKKVSSAASDIVRNKLYESGGQATVYSARGNAYLIQAGNDGVSFFCDGLPTNPPYRYAVFDVMVELLRKNGGTARKGNGRNYKLGDPACDDSTLVGYIGSHYAGKSAGTSVYDPVFVLASILEWAGIAHNRRGYLELTADYLVKLEREPV